MKHVRVAAAIIQKNNSIFAAQRGYGAFCGGWEFPGGKIEHGERPKKALLREIQEELGITVRINGLFDITEYDYPDFHLTLYCYLCSMIEGEEIKLLEHGSSKWLTRETLDSVSWLPADICIIEKLKQRMILREKYPVISPDTLQAQGGIYFDKVLQGVQNYSNTVCKWTADEVIDMVENMWKEKRYKAYYVDCYYFRLDPSEKEKANACLTQEELDYLMLRQDTGLIFPLDHMLLRISAKWNQESLLFSTYYFVGEHPQTWWGDYRMQYIVFENPPKHSI